MSTVVSIFIAPTSGAPMQQVTSVEAIPGEGLRGDRYHAGAGTFSKATGNASSVKPREVTLIEAEAVEAAQRDYGLRLAPEETRRNILVRGVALNHLVSREFNVGGVRMKGIELCEPCGYLERLTRPGVREAMVHRGGLRCEIVSGGVINVGDRVG